MSNVSRWTLVCRHGDPSSGPSGRDSGLTVRPEEVPAGLHPVGTGADAAGSQDSSRQSRHPVVKADLEVLRYACIYGVQVLAMEREWRRSPDV